MDDLGDDDQEILCVKLKKNNKEQICIVMYYGKQENASAEEIEMEYANLRTQINSLSK